AHGLIQPVSLPAADREESLAPGTPHPYKQYQVECHAPGYYRVIHAHVSVFEGVTTTQTVNMIPLPEGMERGNMVFEQTGEADL
ncbi:MAG: hypothetical protein FWF49_05760, partial [Oscillospiraceae bacterium]|nr:hypothetical protein [Oscillospiraceae bacterium]